MSCGWPGGWPGGGQEAYHYFLHSNLNYIFQVIVTPGLSLK